MALMVDAGGTSQTSDRRRTPITKILAVVLTLVTLIPFLPLVWFTWSGYQREVDKIELEIQESNRHIASLAAFHLDDIIARVRLEARLAHASRTLPVWWEQISPEGRVVASEIDAHRIGSDSGYSEFLVFSPGESLLISPVGEWITGLPPTVVFGDA